VPSSWPNRLAAGAVLFLRKLLYIVASTRSDGEPVTAAVTFGARTGESDMRLIFGIIIGFGLTVGGAYIADTMSSPAAGSKMVNWDVVAKNLDTVTALAREGWKKISG